MQARRHCLGLIAGTFLLASCAGTTPPPGTPVTGSWGGEHIGLELTAEGGRIEYDCGAGRIDGPVLPGSDGRFTVSGSHTPGQGGPDRVGYEPPTFAARYSGRVKGDVMDLRVDVPGNPSSPGSFRLTRGADPMLMRCL